MLALTGRSFGLQYYHPSFDLREGGEGRKEGRLSSFLSLDVWYGQVHRSLPGDRDIPRAM